MLKKTLNKHTREFLEKNLPESFFLLKKSNKKRKIYFDLKGNFVKTHLHKLKKNYTFDNFKYKNDSTVHNTLAQPEKLVDLRTDVNKRYITNFLFSLNSIKNQFEKRQSRASDFKNKLKEKKKLSILYGNLSNKKISKALRKAEILNGSGFASENLLDILESRLDIILYRALFFPSIRSARQFITANKVLVNCFRISIPGYIVKYGDIISIPKKHRKHVASTMLKHFLHYNTINKSVSQTWYANSNKKNFDFLQNAKIPELNRRFNSIHEKFFPKFTLISSIYKNINSLNKMFSHCLILCENMYCKYRNFSQNTYFLGDSITKPVCLPTAVKAIPRFFNNYREIYYSISTIEKTPGKISKMLFLQLCKNISRVPHLVSKKPRNSMTTSSTLQVNTFIEKSICDISNNRFKIFYIFSALKGTNSRVKKLPEYISANFAVTQHAYTYLTRNLCNEIIYKRIVENSVKYKKKFFIYKNIFDIILKAKLINVFNKKNINLENIFCKLAFTKAWQQTVILFVKQKNMYNYISKFISNFFFKNFLFVKNGFKKKQRYIISCIYLKTLVNQVKLSNNFLFKFTVDLLNKNYLIQDIYTKHNYILSHNNYLVTKTNNLNKNVNYLSNYTNILIIKYKILLSTINCNFKIIIKDIFKNIPANYFVGDTNKISILSSINYFISHIKYYDLLFFLKLKKFFLYKANAETTINVKPLNLEISYKTLTIIYLYPTQKLVLPCSLDVELLLRYTI